MTERARRVNLPSVIKAKENSPIYAGDIGREVDGEIRQFNLSAGESPFGPPPEYRDIILRIAQSNERFNDGTVYKEVNVERAKESVRERFELSLSPSIFFSSNGSYGILERLPGLFTNTQVRVFGIGPHFPSIDKFVTSYRNEGALQGRISYTPISTPLDTELSDTINEAIKFRQGQGKLLKNIAFYLCNPGTPKGDRAPLSKVKEFAELCNDKGDLLIIDEAFGDFLPDNESAIPLTEDHPLIVLRTLSKGIGIPGERIGYATMHRDIGNLYKETNLLVFDMPIQSQMMANEIMDSQIILPHLSKVREATREIKIDLTQKLEENGIKALPTSLDTPILTLDLLHEDTYKRLLKRGLILARGKGFSHTYSSQAYGTLDHQFTDRYARMTVPKNLDDIDSVINILVEEV